MKLNVIIFKTVLLALIELCLLTCGPSPKNTERLYCGYEITVAEYEELNAKSKIQGSAYEADTLGNIYSQLNDTIRAAMPDSIDFEIFMTVLNKTQVVLEVYVPRLPGFFDRIGCAVMNSRFSKEMPEQRYVLLHYYSSGSAAVTFETGIKRRN